MSSEEPIASVSQADAFPLADVRETSGGLRAMVKQTRLWLLTLACLGLAAWLAWASVPQRGPRITVTFPEGHGLKAGDAVRYRGIEVGQVEVATLSTDLQSVEAVVVLNPEAEAIGREGSRFWIVRPVVSLTEVRGLETLVGARYIGVSPGDPESPSARAFEGLPAPPADELAAGGLTIVLRAPQRHGIGPGSPIDWRGIPVGVVLSAGLAPDARHVDFTVRIDRPYRRLVRAESRFWITAGFGMDISLTGIRLNAESLATIARGGISFMTPASSSDEECRSGQVFPVSEPPDEAWLALAGSAPFVEFDLPDTVTVDAEVRTSFLGFARTTLQTQSGLLIDCGNETLLVTPDFAGVRMRVTHPAFGDRVLRIANRSLATGDAEGGDVPEAVTAPGRSGGPTGEDIVQRDLGGGLIGLPVTFRASAVTPAAFRRPMAPEACLMVRSAVSQGRIVPVIQALDAHQLASSPAGHWQLVDRTQDLTSWNGAAVVSTADGRLLGILVADERETSIQLASERWWSSTPAIPQR